MHQVHQVHQVDYELCALVHQWLHQYMHHVQTFQFTRILRVSPEFYSHHPLTRTTSQITRNSPFNGLLLVSCCVLRV